MPEKILTPEEEELQRKKVNLALLEAQLADRELELVTLTADLADFERRYLQTVGRRYAILDELNAKIAEAYVKLNPQKAEARKEAEQARSRAQESARAVGEEQVEAVVPDDTESPSKPNRTESLRKLYRQAAWDYHPDRTLDPDEQKRRHRLMTEINEAYARGDEERVRAILRDWHASPENVPGDGPGAELIRVIRKIAQVEKRLETIAAEVDQHRQGELFKLSHSVHQAQANGRDLLAEMVQRLDSQIGRAREELVRATEKDTA